MTVDRGGIRGIDVERGRLGARARRAARRRGGGHDDRARASRRCSQCVPPRAARRPTGRGRSSATAWSRRWCPAAPERAVANAVAYRERRRARGGVRRDGRRVRRDRRERGPSGSGRGTMPPPASSRAAVTCSTPSRWPWRAAWTVWSAPGRGAAGMDRKRQDRRRGPAQRPRLRRSAPIPSRARCKHCPRCRPTSTWPVTAASRWAAS